MMLRRPPPPNFSVRTALCLCSPLPVAVVKLNATVEVALAPAGASEGETATVIGGDLGGFAEPVQRGLMGQNATLTLGPFGVATLVLTN
eukprot:SAG31_NODE_39573_length_287_cov_0.819149_1_plen_89_part_01